MGKRKTRGSTESTRNKYERLNALSRASFVSQSALRNMLGSVKSDGLPESFSRGSQHRARKEVCHTETYYGPLVTERNLNITSGQPLTVGFQNPLAWVHYHCEHSPNYASIVQQALEKHPCTLVSPWTIILYQDGVDPGDGLAKNKSRHSVVFYWSFLEFGMEVLCREEVWGTLTIMRTTKAKKLEGGIPELTYRSLEQFHCDVHDIRRNGVSVCCDGSGTYIKIFGRVNLIVSDLPALAEMLSSKGHSALKCCPKCMNATNHKPPGGAVPIHVYGDYCVPISETDFTKFHPHTDASLRATIQSINALKENPLVTDAAREEKETVVYGYNWTPWSIILNKRFDIDVASAIMFDWVHCYVSDGLADKEFGVFMKVMHRVTTQNGMHHSCTYAALGEYLCGWKWPKGRGNPMHLLDAAHAKRFIKSEDFACTASEFLTLAPIINRFLKRVVFQQVEGTHVDKNVLSMIAVLDVIGLLQACKVKGAVSPETLYEFIKLHLDYFKTAYGDIEMRPKHHYVLHLAKMLERFGILMGTLTHERKHRAVKRYSRGATRTDAKFEVGVLEEVTCHNMWELSSKQWHAFSTYQPSRRQQWWLETIFPDEPKDVRFTLHSEVHANGYITRGDIVTFMSNGEMCIGELQANVGLATDASARMVSIVSKWDHDRREEHTNCMVNDESILIPTTDIICPLTYHMSADRKTCVVVMPYELIPHARDIVAS